MSRTTEFVPETVQRMQRVVTLKCDKCGAEYEQDDHYTNTVVVWMDPEECVSFGHQRDYCGNCSGKIWADICAIIGADPDSEEKTGFEDE